MAGGVVVLTDQRGSTTKEGVGTGRDDDTLGFTLFTGGTSEKMRRSRYERKEVDQENDKKKN